MLVNRLVNGRAARWWLRRSHAAPAAHDQLIEREGLGNRRDRCNIGAAFARALRDDPLFASVRSPRRLSTTPLATRGWSAFVVPGTWTGISSPRFPPRWAPPVSNDVELPLPRWPAKRVRRIRRGVYRGVPLVQSVPKEPQGGTAGTGSRGIRSDPCEPPRPCPVPHLARRSCKQERGSTAHRISCVARAAITGRCAPPDRCAVR